jgi:hypothetical protein
VVANIFEWPKLQATLERSFMFQEFVQPRPGALLHCMAYLAMLRVSQQDMNDIEIAVICTAKYSGDVCNVQLRRLHPRKVLRRQGAA